MSGEEDLLCCILRLDRVAKEKAAEPEDHAAMSGEEFADERAGRPGVGAADCS